MRRSYKLVTPRGTTSKRFTNLVAAYRYLKRDSPDLQPSLLVGTSHIAPLHFADGYRFYRSDLR